MTDVVMTVTKKQVRNFGLLFASIGAGAGSYLVYTGSTMWGWVFGMSLVFLVTGLFAWKVLAPFYKAWMKLAHVLAWINTRLLLGIFFYLIVTLTGLLLRMIGKDILDQNIDRSAKSYWKRRVRQPFDLKRYERLF